MTERIHRRIDRTPEDKARLKELRERLQREKPTVEQLLAESGAADTMPLGAYLEMELLARDLKREREKQGLSLTDLGSRTGIDPAALSRLENGRQANPTVGTLGRVARALGKRIVLTLADVPPEEATAAK